MQLRKLQLWKNIHRTPDVFLSSYTFMNGGLKLELAPQRRSIPKFLRIETLTLALLRLISAFLAHASWIAGGYWTNTHPENVLDVGPGLEMRRDPCADQFALCRHHGLEIPVP